MSCLARPCCLRAQKAATAHEEPKLKRPCSALAFFTKAKQAGIKGARAQDYEHGALPNKPCQSPYSA